MPSYRRELGEPWDIAKIYWGAMSESRMRAGLKALRDAGFSEETMRRLLKGGVTSIDDLADAAMSLFIGRPT